MKACPRFERPLDSIIIDVRPGGFHVATYLQGDKDHPTLIGGPRDPVDVLRMVAEALGVPCPEWMPTPPGK